MKYRVLSGASAQSLEEQVVDLMSDGYMLQGGATVTAASDGSIIFSQAMVNPQIKIIMKGKSNGRNYSRRTSRGRDK